MSFFSKLNSKFEGMMKDDNGNQQPANGQRGYEQQQYGQGYPPQQQQYQQQSYTPQYQTPPPAQSQQWGAPPSQYGSPAPSQQYGAFSPPAAGLPPTPGVPQGWLALWDPAGQRWAYLDLSNNTVSWSVPIAPAYAAGGGGYDPNRGAGGGYGGYGGQQGGYQDPAPAKDNSKKNMMMGAAAGVAVGAVGGMVLANALDDHDNHGDGGSMSSSDREEVEEAYGSD